jgi:hypothetical protein
MMGLFEYVVNKEGERVIPIQPIDRFGKVLHILSLNPPLLYEAETKTFYCNIETIEDKEGLLKNMATITDNATIEDKDGKKYLSFKTDKLKVILNQSETEPTHETSKGFGKGRKKGAKALLRKRDEGQKVSSLILKVGENFKTLIYEGARQRGFNSYAEYVRHLISNDLSLLGITDEATLQHDRQVYILTDRLFKQRMAKLPQDRREEVLKNEPEVKRIKSEIRERVKAMRMIEKEITG